MGELYRSLFIPGDLCYQETRSHDNKPNCRETVQQPTGCAYDAKTDVQHGFQIISISYGVDCTVYTRSAKWVHDEATIFGNQEPHWSKLSVRKNK